MTRVLSLLRPGDWLILVVAAWAVWGLARQGSGADRVLIKQEGRVFMETTPRLDQDIAVPGPLGDTLVEIRNGRVRVKSDPGPQQRCVRQGWLMPGQVAVCLPNRVSVERGVVRYDSLNY
ncbi:MAG: NusG domain II-containing protein [Pseudomonadota bacterium]